MNVLPSAAVAERLVCFFLDDQELGVAIGEVKETIEWKPLTPVFLVPDYIAGVINLRGDVVAVLDLARLLGMPSRPPSHESRIVILRGRSPSKPVSAGLAVDRLSEVRDLDGEALRPPPSTLAPEVAGYLRGVGRVEDRPLLVLDLGRILESEKLTAFRRRA